MTTATERNLDCIAKPQMTDDGHLMLLGLHQEWIGGSLGDEIEFSLSTGVGNQYLQLRVEVGGVKYYEFVDIGKVVTGWVDRIVNDHEVLQDK